MTPQEFQESPRTVADLEGFDAEEYTLGCLLFWGKGYELLDGLCPEDFADRRNQKIFSAIMELQETSRGYDECDVVTELREKGWLVGDLTATYVTRLTEFGSSIETLPRRVRLLKDRAFRKHLATFGSKAIDAAEGQDASEAMAIVEQNWAFIRQQTHDDNRIWSASELTQNLLLHMENEQTKPSGLPTGFEALDGILGGLHPSDLVIVAARPAMGKSAFAMSLAANASKRGKQTLVFTLEMDARQLWARMLATASGVPLSRLRQSKALTQSDWGRLTARTPDMAALRIGVTDKGQQSLDNMIARCRGYQAKNGLDMIIIDYLQLMIGDKGESREREVAEISRGLKLLGKELRVPVVALAQLNRGLESRAEKRPQLSDLRDSGSIEQDADIVMFLYREEVYNPETPNKGVAEVIVAKHRNGPLGNAKLRFDHETTRFADVHA